MTNPFSKKIANKLATKAEKKLKIDDAFKKVDEEIGDTNACFNSKVNEAQNLQELLDAVSGLDLEVLLTLFVLRLQQASSKDDFGSLLVYGNQALNYFSCVFNENLTKYDGSVTKALDLNLGLAIEEIALDFFKQFRKTIENTLETLTLKLVKNIFNDLLNFVDCDKINKCVVPCDPKSEDNPYKNIFVGILYKTGIEPALKLGKLIADEGLDVEVSKVEEIYKDIEKKFLPEELDCLYKGIKSSSGIDLIKNIIKSVLGKDPEPELTQVIVDNIPDLFEAVPVAANDPSQPNPINPCGLISLENIAKLRLMRRGYTEEEAEQILAQKAEETKNKLQTVAELLTNASLLKETVDTGNAQITKTVVNNSIDLLFSSLNINNTSVVPLTTILSITGDACIAYYYINNMPLPDALPQDIKDKFKYEINPMSLPGDALAFLLNPNFYKRYDLPIQKIDSYSIQYNNNSVISFILNNQIKFTCTKYKLIDTVQPANSIDLKYNIENIYIENNERNDISDIIQSQNNPLLYQYISVDTQSMFTDSYLNVLKYIQQDLDKLFYFQEYYIDNTDSELNKKKYINTDYLSIEDRKQALKDKLNV
jgi:hypothetical protein